MTTTVEYIRYRIGPEGQTDFEDAYRRAGEALTAAPECIDYELSRCDEEPESYILRIRWTSAEDHLQGFRRGPHFPAFFQAIKPYVSDIEEMRHYTATGVRGTGGAVVEG
jgi:quinol monooxygenase YgiN